MKNSFQKIKKQFDKILKIKEFQNQVFPNNKTFLFFK